MRYKIQDFEIDLKSVTRLYPAAVVSVDGERAQVSLEWAEMKADIVAVESYILVFDIDPLDELPKNRIEAVFESRDELMQAINDVAKYL
jgi:hypothetical protein